MDTEIWNIFKHAGKNSIWQNYNLESQYLAWPPFFFNTAWTLLSKNLF